MSVDMMDFTKHTKADKILGAALTCFKQYGFKRTSMDDIAKAADISRPAIYNLFKNKTDVFRSLSQQFHVQTLQNAAATLAEKTPLQQRIARAMTARMSPLYALAHDSLHGPELFDVNQSTSADINTQADDDFMQMLTAALQDGLDAKNITGGTETLAARELAQFIIASAKGLKSFAFSAKDYETLLGKSVSTFFQGLSPK